MLAACVCVCAAGTSRRSCSPAIGRHSSSIALVSCRLLPGSCNQSINQSIDGPPPASSPSIRWPAQPLLLVQPLAGLPACLIGCESVRRSAPPMPRCCCDRRGGAAHHSTAPRTRTHRVEPTARCRCRALSGTACASLPASTACAARGPIARSLSCSCHLHSPCSLALCPLITSCAPLRPSMDPRPARLVSIVRARQ